MADSSIWSTQINVRIVSSNPILKLLNLVLAIVEFFLGIRRKGTMSEHEDHIVIDTRNKVLWFFTSSEDTMKISKNRIAGVKIGNTKSLIFFRSVVCTLYAAGITEATTYGVKEPYAKMKERAVSWVSA